MLATLVGIVGALCIVFGMSHLLIYLDMNVILIEIVLYALVGALILVPQLPMAENFNEFSRFLMSFLGLLALPFLEALTAAYHSENQRGIEDLFSFIGVSTGIIGLAIGKLNKSQLIIGYALLSLYFGLNNWLPTHLKVYQTRTMSTAELVSLTNVVVSVMGLAALVAYHWYDWKPIQHMDKAISVVCTGMLFGNWVYLGVLDTNRLYSFFIHNSLFLLVSYCLYNFSRNFNLTVMRGMITLSVLVWLISKYVFFPWANWSGRLVLFGLTLYGVSLYLPQ
jgi:hypothetical protein